MQGFGKQRSVLMVFSVTVLLTGCAANTAPLVADPKLCEEAWREIQTCQQDKLTNDTAQRILKSNEARIGLGCPKSAERQSCPTVVPPRVAAVNPKTS